MFRWLIDSSLRARFLVLAAALMLVVFGTMQLRQMPVDVFPEFAPPMVEVQTEAIGLSADEVESLITLGLEELLTGVPWLESTRSTSVTGLSSIVLIFKRGTDIIKARQMVQERLALAYTLPNVATPPVVLQPVSSTSRFMMVGITSDTIDPTELSLLARWTIKPRLVGVPGVANVAIWGQRLRQLHVHIDPSRLRDAALTQEDIITTVGDALWVSPLTFLRASAPGAGGWIDNHNQRLGVEHSMPIEAPEDIAKVPISSPALLASGKRLTLGDVTEVTFAHPPLIGDAIVNGGNGLILVIDKFPSASTPEVTREVEKALAELSRGLPGVRIDPGVFRLASYIEESLADLTFVIASGAVVVALVLLGLLFSWRGALVCLVSIPLSLFAAVIVLDLTGATMNTMILAGLAVALGTVIDDVVLDVDRLLRLLRAGGDRTLTAALIRDTTIGTRGTALYAALIVVLAVAPIFFMGGVSGAFFEPLALSYVLAVAASVLVALTVTPALCLLLLRDVPASGRDPPVVAWAYDRYEKILRRELPHARALMAAAGALMVVGLGATAWLGQSLLPSLIEHEVLVNWSTPAGTSQAETYRITARACRELRGLPGVTNVGAHIGRAVTGDQLVGINAGQIWISIDPRADYDGTIGAIRETVDGYPGIEHSVQTYLRDTVGEALTGQHKEIVVRLYGPRRDILRGIAADVRLALAEIPGVADLGDGGETEEPQVEVNVNLDAAGQANVKPGDVRRSAATVFSGIVAGYLFKEQKIIEVVVWSAPEVRRSLTDLRELLVDTTDGGRVRLADVATVNIHPTPAVIRHERIAPYVDVVLNVLGHDPSAVAEAVEDRLKTIEFPLEYHPELLGEYAEREDAQQRILRAALAAMVGIFLLLQACFGSWRFAGLAFVSLPASIAGGVLSVWVTGGVVSLGSIVGFLAVLGIAARNSVLLIDNVQRLQMRGGPAEDFELVIGAARERLLPIVASAAAIIGAMLPVVVFGRAPGLEVIRPMAVVIIGGTITSTLFTVLVMPIVCGVIGSPEKPDPALDLGHPSVG